MQLKLDSKLLKAINGLFFVAIALTLMINSTGWAIGLFMMLGACALGYASYLEKCDLKLAAIALLYFLFAIVFFAKDGMELNFIFIAAWAAIEGALLAIDGMKAKEEKAAFWYVPVCLGALAILFGFIQSFVEPTFSVDMFAGSIKTKIILGGLAFLFVAIGRIFPLCEQFLPKKK